MEERLLTDTAIQNLAKAIPVTGRWNPLPHEKVDGTLDFVLNNDHYRMHTLVRRQLRGATLYQLQDLNATYKNFIVITDHLFPRLKKELRERNINYLEANGNVYMKLNKTILLVDTNDPLPAEPEKTAGRAFTKTGLKVLFEILLNEAIINAPYREIAKRTGTALGNINNIMKDLKEQGFLLPVPGRRVKINNKQELFNKWIEAYHKKLKPALRVGRFRFLKEEELHDWKTLTLNFDKNWWGGEPAAQLLTNYLRPARLTLYTEENKSDLIKNYRLVPDETGQLDIYERFWKFHEVSFQVTPPLLVYADLMGTGDPRCIETAEKLYGEYLQKQF